MEFPSTPRAASTESLPTPVAQKRTADDGKYIQTKEARAYQKRALVDVVGCGAVIRRLHLPALKWLERQGLVEVRYCLDPNLQAASDVALRFQRARPVSISSPIDWDGSGASTVVVATPPEQHSGWAHNYLEAGAHVLIEKPAVLTMEQFSLLRDAARARQRAVLVGHVRRLFPSVNAAREAVTSGKIGRVRRIEAFAGDRWSWTTQSDFPISSPAGGVLYDLGSHVLDMALFICGMDDLDWNNLAAKDLRVERWPAREPAHDINAEFVLQLTQLDLPIALRLSRRMPLANLVRVQGDKGEVIVDVWYRQTILLRTDGVSKLAGEASSIYTTSAEGCFVGEHLEMWRAWALADRSSPLALAHFGLLTWLLETLARGS